jgi:hypothetical protein
LERKASDALVRRDGNQLLVYIAPTPDGRGAVNSWALAVGRS